MNNKTIKYQLISASGNPTAVINGQYDIVTKKYINQQIFLTNKLVEQIAYTYYSNNKYSLEMMGNEFSGNGCRSACFSFLKSKSGEINLFSSGSTKVIRCSLDKQKNSTVQIPYQFDPILIIKNKYGFLINMFGSNLLIIKGKGSISEAKIIIDNQFLNTNATGIMYYQKILNGYEINPFFYVKETKSLINETACGSGSVALAVYLSYKDKLSYNNLKIIQPSQEPIFVSLINKNKTINNISISGPTELLGNYNVKI